MQNNLKTLFLDNLELDNEIAAFLAQDPEFVRAEREFYAAAQEIAQAAGYEPYDRFERRLGRYLSRLSDLYYLFGLGLRQEILQAMGAATPL